MCPTKVGERCKLINLDAFFELPNSRFVNNDRIKQGLKFNKKYRSLSTITPMNEPNFELLV